MDKISAEEMRNEGETLKESGIESHPYAFHVSGPRNVSSPNWKDLINSSWLVSSTHKSYFFRDSDNLRTLYFVQVWV